MKLSIDINNDLHTDSKAKHTTTADAKFMMPQTKHLQKIEGLY